MVTITRRTATMLVAGALGLGGLAIAAPALAGNGPSAAPTATGTATPGRGYGMGSGYGHGMGYGFEAQDGSGAGGCMGLGAGVTAAQGTLTGAQKSTLASMAQEEKLAHDLYTAFADRYDLVVFDHIAVSETQHLAAVRTLVQRYGIADPTAGQADGTFTDPAVQATYTRLFAQGAGGSAAALAVGQQVERADIADLKAGLTGLSAPDVQQVYNRLLAASERHLIAFTHWATR